MGKVRIIVSAVCASGLAAGLLFGAINRGAAPVPSPQALDTAFILDGGFARTGAVVQPGSNGANGVAVVPASVANAGEIMAAGGDGTHFQVARFTSRGALDGSFGGGITNLINGQANAVTVVPHGVSGAGDVVAVGYRSNSVCGVNVATPVVVEYRPNGSLNTTSFGSGTGVVAIPCLGSAGKLLSVAVEPNGNIDVAGEAFGTANSTLMTAASLGPTGHLNWSASTLAGGSSAVANAVAFSPLTGDVMAAGWTFTGGKQYLVVAAFKAGALATGFNEGIGFVRASNRPGSVAQGLVVLPNGNIVAGGTTNTSTGSFFLDALTSTGAAVPGFGSGSQVVNSPALNVADGLLSLAYQRNGNFISAAGRVGLGQSEHMVVTQYNATTGALNHGFGSGGTVTRSFGAGQLQFPSSLSAVAVQGDGKTVAAGRAPVINGVEGMALMRVFGPVVTVVNPALVKVTSAAPITVRFPVSLSEPLFSAVGAVFCVSAGASINGGRCGTVNIPRGVTHVAVPVRISIFVAPGHAEQIRLTSLPGNGLAPSPSHGFGVVIVQRLLPPPPYKGYWMVASDGGVFNFGTTRFFGSTGNITLAKPMVGMAATPSGNGYWLVASDGGIFAFGKAGFHGSTGAIALTKPIVGMARTIDGKGYWLVASDGGIFAFGDARFFGSTGNIHLNKPIVGMAATPDGRGYWLVASDGGIFSFGDAGFFGSTGNIALNQPIVGMAAYPGAGGYWLVASDGGIFSFGGARFHGSTGGITLNKPIVGMTATPSGDGYLLAASDGGIFAFGNARFFGSTGNITLNKPIVGMFG